MSPALTTAMQSDTWFVYPGWWKAELAWVVLGRRLLHSNESKLMCSNKVAF